MNLSIPKGIELPPSGFDSGEETFIAPPDDVSSIEVKVSASSERLQLLEPFPAWDGNDYEYLPVLVKAKRKIYNRSYLYGRTSLNTRTSGEYIWKPLPRGRKCL